MSTGWIKLHRQLLDWEWYDDINTSRLFIHLMLTANHKDNNWRGIEIKRGSRLTSLDKLSGETKLSVSKIRTSIKKLISTNEIASKSHSQHTVFTMINYDLYQSDDKQIDKRIANESQTNRKRIATNKNDKNVKNVKNEKELKIYPPSLNILAWEKWLAFRKVAKFKKYKTDATLKKLAGMGNLDEQLLIVNQSIDNEYQGLFALKRNNNEGHKNTSKKLSAYERIKQRNDEMYRQPSERELVVGENGRDLG